MRVKKLEIFIRKMLTKQETHGILNELRLMGAGSLETGDRTLTNKQQCNPEDSTLPCWP